MAAPHRSPPPHPAIGIGMDAAMVGVSLVLAILIRSSAALEPLWQALDTTSRGGMASWDRNEWALTIYQAFAVPTLLFALGQYRLVRDPQAVWSFNRMLLGVAATFGVLLAILFALRITTVPRATLILDFLLLVMLTSSWRSVWSARVQARNERGEGLRNVLILGRSGLPAKVASHIVTNPNCGRRLVGFITDEPQPADDAPDAEGLLVPGTPLSVPGAAHAMTRQQPRHLWASIFVSGPGDIEHALDGLSVEEVMIGPQVPEPVMRQVIARCQARGIDVHLIPEHHEELGIRPSAWNLGRFTLFDVHRRPISRVGWVAKRAIDILAAVAALVVASPIILLCVLAIQVERPGMAPFYGGRRVGLRGRHFRQWKFATMRPDADRFRDQLKAKNAREGPWFQLDEEDDPRITRVGRLLRKYSLNDIPQFWNVLTGDMSLVGPRPLAVDEVARFVEFDLKYYRVFDVKPGITGLWQISDRMNPSFEYRVMKDFEYIQDWSIWNDAKIILMTPFAMLKGGR